MSDLVRFPLYALLLTGVICLCFALAPVVAKKKCYTIPVAGKTVVLRQGMASDEVVGLMGRGFRVSSTRLRDYQLWSYEFPERSWHIVMHNGRLDLVSSRVPGRSRTRSRRFAVHY